MTVNVKIRGAAQLHMRLNRLPKEMERKVLNSALRAGGRVIIKAAKEKAPIETGTLRKSLIAKLIRKDRVGGGVVLQVGTSKAAFYAHIIEFGSRHVGATPFLRPAVDENRQAIVSAIGVGIARGLVRLAKK